MNRIKYSFFLCVLIMAGGYGCVEKNVPVSIHQTSKSSALPKTSWQTSARLRDVAISGTANVVCVGDGGLVLQSSDSGDHWVARYPEAAKNGLGHYPDWQAVALVTGNIGYLGGTGGTLLRTENAGRTWTVVPAFPLQSETIRSIFFKNQLTGWVGTVREVFVTEDGGKSWLSITQNATYALNFHASGNGIAAGPSSGVFQILNQNPRKFSNGNLPRTTLYENPHCVNVYGSSGFVVAVGNQLFGLRDKNARWQAMGRFPYRVRGVVFIDSKTGVVCGDHGLLMFTRDGGRSWRKMSSRRNVPLMSVSAVKTSSGILVIAVGPEGAICQSLIAN